MVETHTTFRIKVGLYRSKFRNWKMAIPITPFFVSYSRCKINIFHLSEMIYKLQLGHSKYFHFIREWRNLITAVLNLN